MEIYEVSEDTAAIIATVNELSDNVVAAVIVIAALVGMILGYLAMSELLKIWID